MLKHLAEDTGQGDRTIVGWVRFIPFFGVSSLWRVCRTIGLGSMPMMGLEVKI